MFRPVDRYGNMGDARITDRGVALVVKGRAEMAGMDRARCQDTRYEQGWRPLLQLLGSRRGLLRRRRATSR